MKRAPYWQGIILCLFTITLPGLVQAMSCHLLSAIHFNFGLYDPLSPSPTDVQATYALQCIPDHPNERLKLRITVLNANGITDSLQGSVVAKPLRFGLYLDPNRTIAIDTQTRIDINDRLSTVNEYPITIYGRLPPKQNIPAGNYRASLTFLIEY